MFVTAQIADMYMMVILFTLNIAPANEQWSK